MGVEGVRHYGRVYGLRSQLMVACVLDHCYRASFSHSTGPVVRAYGPIVTVYPQPLGHSHPLLPPSVRFSVPAPTPSAPPPHPLSRSTLPLQPETQSQCLPPLPVYDLPPPSDCHSLCAPPRVELAPPLTPLAQNQLSSPAHIVSMNIFTPSLALLLPPLSVCCSFTTPRASNYHPLRPPSAEPVPLRNCL